MRLSAPSSQLPAAAAPRTPGSCTEFRPPAAIPPWPSGYRRPARMEKPTPFRATPATMQFTIHNDAKLSKLMPAQPLTANGSGGFSSRETHRTQPASRDTTPRVRGLAADPNEAARPKKRRRSPQAGSPPQAVATAPHKPPLVYQPGVKARLGNRTAATFPHAQRRPQPCRTGHPRANLGSRPPARAYR